MRTNFVFSIWLICTIASYHGVKSAATSNRHNVKDNCKRLENELDGNNIVSERRVCNSRPNLDDYFRDRADLLTFEAEASFGSDITLTDNEMRANDIIMKLKKDELDTGFVEPYLFNPSRHMFEVLDVIKHSKLFEIIQKMPKGGILHAHDIAMCSANYIVSLTYWPDLWQRSSNTSDEIEEFIFSRNHPKDQDSFGSEESNFVWRLVKDVRAEEGPSKYDQRIRSMFTLFDKNINPRTQFKDINDAWNHLDRIFRHFRPIITFAPVWKAYYKHALKQMQEDGVQYLEFRGSFHKLYDLDGKQYGDFDTVRIHIEALDEFKSENLSFIGSKFIYAPGKFIPNDSIAISFDDIRRLHAKFPDFLAGFDLVGQEDPAPRLVSFAEHILQLPDDIKFFFHAGETNWFGSVDENMIDAILLGSRRIGHGYALAKHPKLIEFIKANDIAVEVNPISNQVLKLVDDFRNHPASVFMAQNIPFVISSDDPSFWEVSPLSHDFYVTFLGIASRHSDLRTLKKLAINSIRYSSLNETEKLVALAKWQVKWDKFINDLAKNQLL